MDARPGSSRRDDSWFVGKLALCGTANWYGRRPCSGEEVCKSSRLYRGGELIRSYPVSLGRTPRGPKQQAGDGRTPEGPYRLDYRKLDSSFHRALHISYPGKDDVAAAIVRGVDPGRLIMVHGMKNGLGWIGRAHRAVDWTDGCVAVTDREIEEIVSVVPDGTPITIEP